MPSGSRRVEVGSDHHSPLKVLLRFFSARTEYSTTSTTAFRPTSFHMLTIASDMALSWATYPIVVSMMMGSFLYPDFFTSSRASFGSNRRGGRDES